MRPHLILSKGCVVPVSLNALRFMCAIVVAGTLLSGCGSTSAENAALASKPLAASKARLKIFRTDTIVAAAVAARVRVDGREVASLGAGGSTVLDVPAGARKIVVDAWGHPNAYAITLQA